MKKIITRFKDSTENFAAKIAVHLCSQMVLQKKAFAYYDYPRLKKQYGDFNLDKDYSNKHIMGLSKESGIIRGVIVNIIEKAEQNINRVLLPGEYISDKSHYSTLFSIDNSNIVTAGIGDVDYDWNFEDDPPSMGKFDLIVTQAMLEHLLNPYKHVVELSQILNPGGLLIIHTHIPGFAYHRYPVDCIRFYPDWFEEMAIRLDMSVFDRYIGDLRVCYTLQQTL